MIVAFSEPSVCPILPPPQPKEQLQKNHIDHVQVVSTPALTTSFLPMEMLCIKLYPNPPTATPTGLHPVAIISQYTATLAQIHDPPVSSVVFHKAHPGPEFIKAGKGLFKPFFVIGIEQTSCTKFCPALTSEVASMLGYPDTIDGFNSLTNLIPLPLYIATVQHLQQLLQHADDIRLAQAEEEPSLIPILATHPVAIQPLPQEH